MSQAPVVFPPTAAYRCVLVHIQVHVSVDPARGAGTLIPSAQRFVWPAKQRLGNAALGALFA